MPGDAIASGVMHLGSGANAFRVPGMVNAPTSLKECARLTNYGLQQTLHLAHVFKMKFPNALYVDMVSNDGTIETGPNEENRFAFVDYIIAYNLRVSVECSGHCDAPTHELIEGVKERMERYLFLELHDDLSVYTLP